MCNLLLTVVLINTGKRSMVPKSGLTCSAKKSSSHCSLIVIHVGLLFDELCRLVASVFEVSCYVLDVKIMCI